jgi:hypothetical protein
LHGWDTYIKHGRDEKEIYNFSWKKLNSETTWGTSP